MRTIKLTLGTRDDSIGGHALVLEELDTEQAATTRTTLPSAHVEGSRPRDDHGEALDAAGIRTLVLREAPLPSELELQRVGTYLYGLLAYADVGARWDELRARHPREQPPKEGLRVLLDVRDEELRPLPWELARREPVWVFADQRNAFARIRSDYSVVDDDAEDWWPLRIAVVVGAEDGDPEVDVDAERDRLEQSLAKVLPDIDPEFIIRPSREELRTKLEDDIKPHVLHFIGHGESTAQGGVLVMNDQNGRWDWTAGDIAMLGITPRIAVLNACRSGALGAQDGTWQVADAFTALGVPAVVAMQGDIEGRAAAAFAAGLFESLLASDTLDVAVGAGRRRAADAVGFARRDFALPTLTLGEPAERVVPKRYGIAGNRLMRVQATLPVAPLVDRTRERRNLLAHLFHHEMQADALLTTVVGEQQVGKTALVRWALRQLAYRGLDVVYVDLRTPDGVPRTQIGVLRAIRDEIQSACPAPAADPCSFHTWTRDLNHLVHGEPPPADAVTDPVPDEGQEYDADPADLERIFTGFLDVLGAIAQQHPLLIALDHLEAVNPPDLRSDVMTGLIKPIRAARYGQVQLVIAGTGIASAFGDAVRPGLELTVPSFPAAEVRVLATQYLVYHDCWSDKRQILVDALRATDKPWMPVNLQQTLDLARVL